MVDVLDRTFSRYHTAMWPFTSAPVAASTLIVTSLFIVLLFLGPVASAQINGAPASVTSPGFGGHAINGTPPSVTSLGPHGYAPNAGSPSASGASGSHHSDGQRHHHDYGNDYVGPVWYAVPVPYAVDNGAADDDPDNDPNYQGGPTVFDRRGLGARSYVPPLDDPPPAHPASDNAAPADPEPPQVPTTLIFKDGHQLEVGNYAIVGATLFDLTPGHTRRIEIADLNLSATQKENDDHGVVFQLPSPQPN
jgi:hypothetical protein